MGFVGNVVSRAIKKIGRLLWRSLGGKIGVIAGVVFGIIGAASGNFVNIILFVPFFAVLFGAVGTLISSIIGFTKKQVSKSK
jgi:hypothetical protein